MKLREWLTATAIASLALVSIPAAAGGGSGGGATEFTQLMNHFELWWIDDTTAEELAARLQSLDIQRIQHQLEELNIKKMSPDEITKHLRLTKDLKDLKDFYSRVKKLSIDLKNAKQSVQKVFQTMSVNNLTPSEMLKAEVENVKRRKDTVEHVFSEQQAAMENVEDSYKSVREYADQINMSTGAHQALQVLSSQMNTMIAQNAQLIRLVVAQAQVQQDKELRSIQKQDADNKAQNQKSKKFQKEKQTADAYIQSLQEAYGK